MGTKKNPGKFNCYENADPDEPMFVLLGRDPMAAWLVRVWAKTRMYLGESSEKVAEAQLCASAMESWSRALGKTEPTEMLRVAARTIVGWLPTKIRARALKAGMRVELNVEGFGGDYPEFRKVVTVELSEGRVHITTEPPLAPFSLPANEEVKVEGSGGNL